MGPHLARLGHSSSVPFQEAWRTVSQEYRLDFRGGPRTNFGYRSVSSGVCGQLWTSRPDRSQNQGSLSFASGSPSRAHASSKSRTPEFESLQASRSTTSRIRDFFHARKTGRQSSPAAGPWQPRCRVPPDQRNETSCAACEPVGGPSHAPTGPAIRVLVVVVLTAASHTLMRLSRRWQFFQREHPHPTAQYEAASWIFAPPPSPFFPGNEAWMSCGRTSPNFPVEASDHLQPHGLIHARGPAARRLETSSLIPGPFVTMHIRRVPAHTDNRAISFFFQSFLPSPYETR